MVQSLSLPLSLVLLLFVTPAAASMDCSAQPSGCSASDDKTILLQGVAKVNSENLQEAGQNAMLQKDQSKKITAEEDGGGEDQAEHEDNKPNAVHSSQPFATVPIKWVIITKKDGTGHMSKADLGSRMAALNTYYNGGDPEDITEARVKQINAIAASPGTCGEKCDLVKCTKSEFSHLIKTEGCFCDTVVCKDWSIHGKLQGPRANMRVAFKVDSIKYVVNDEWHEECCCAHDGRPKVNGKDPNKQVEIVDSVVDKTKVRSSVTAIVCNMKTTLGMANILGSKGTCAGGPWVMLSTNFPEFTFAHEFGHFFGLYHTFNDFCPSGGKFGSCDGVDVCDESKNIGDRISDTPIHKKQGQCTVGTDSCPNSPGIDPLDNMMSYSMCKLRRFTPEQVKRVHETITDYFPAFMGVTSKPKDLPCDPEFPDGYKDGYAVPKKEEPSPAPSSTDSGCNLKPGECDTHDKKGCFCTDATFCCAGHGCAGATGMKQCLPCSWTFVDSFTADSCSK